MAAVVQTNTPAKAPAEASPWKPRLLWRGSLVLADGTALPGVAFVSTCQPYFASSPAAPSSSSHADGAQTKDASTMTREQEADVCLSIEMVRHAPLPILDVVSSSSGHDDPTSSVSFTYQIGTGMRAYIDPKCHSTVAYFERTFCYPSSETPSSPAILLSLETASVALSPQRSTASSPGAQSHDPFSSSYHAAQPAASTMQAGATQFAIMGRRKEVAGVATLELVLGRKIVKRAARRGPSLTFEKKPNAEGWPLRPDDPAPRASSLAQILTAKTKLAAKPGSDSRRVSHGSMTLAPPPPPVRARTEGSSVARRSSIVDLGAGVGSKRKLQKSASTSSVAELVAKKEEQSQQPETSRRSKTGGNHTLGRRGEKRPRREDSFSLPPSLDDNAGEEDEDDEEDWPAQLSPSAERASVTVKRERSESIGPLDLPSRSLTPVPGPLRKAEGTDEQQQQQQQQRNRATIKKLVHHQLLGRGLERHDREYRTCFTPTCTGTALALRTQMGQAPVDRAKAAVIVSTHLDMYLSPSMATSSSNPMPAASAPASSNTR